MARERKFNRAGFTAIELVVSLAIIMLVSAQILVSFSGLGQGTTLNRAMQELVGEIRKAQYAAIAVIYAPTSGLPPSSAVGIRISTVVGATPQALRFIDRKDLPSSFAANNKYDGPNEKIGEYALPSNITINKITDQNDNPYATIHLIFQVPEATLIIADGDGTPISTNHIKIELSSRTGTKKTITVRITGEINAK